MSNIVFLFVVLPSFQVHRVYEFKSIILIETFISEICKLYCTSSHEIYLWELCGCLPREPHVLIWEQWNGPIKTMIMIQTVCDCPGQGSGLLLWFRGGWSSSGACSCDRGRSFGHLHPQVCQSSVWFLYIKKDVYFKLLNNKTTEVIWEHSCLQNMIIASNRNHYLMMNN